MIWSVELIKIRSLEPVTLTPEALEAFETLKQKCVQAGLY